MYKKKEERSELEKKNVISFSISEEIYRYIKRAALLGKSFAIYIALKIRYKKSIKIYSINSIKGLLKIEILPRASLEVGKFLMTSGPCYIKCLEKSNCKIGDKVFFNHNCSITCAKDISIGSNCNIANNVVIVDHDHKMGSYGVIDGLEASPINIGDNVWIGANATILKSCTIGNGSIIAAGAVVNCDVPPYQVWGGIPARFIKDLNEK